MATQQNQTVNQSTSGTFPAIFTTASPEYVLEVASRMSKRGKLPGFLHGVERNSFSALVFSHPFDHTLVVRAVSGKEQPSRTRLEFSMRMIRKMPAIVLAFFVLSAWPGVWLTHSMLTTYFPSWYTIPLYGLWSTSTWYLPLMIGPLPFVWRGMMRKSKAAAMADAMETIGKIESELLEATGAKEKLVVASAG